MLGESIDASLNIIALDVGIERYLRSSILGGLGYGGDDGKVVGSAVIVGAVVVIEGRNGQQSIWIKGVNPREGGVAIGLDLGVMQAGTGSSGTLVMELGSGSMGI